MTAAGGYIASTRSSGSVVIGKIIMCITEGLEPRFSRTALELLSEAMVTDTWLVSVPFGRAVVPDV